ncbi:MAG: hypothetical protein JL50_15680 [Peptococcaceae bacterium BICA1-7]|nr:MAG: hypothetical protein JL50_15680 [Peptococcaceae bacterium BICA1-7]HBV96770.1 DUF3786 domain-containing protein [Desulfotomaculum sp.]
MCNPLNAYQEALKRFARIDPVDAAARSGAAYDSHNKNFEIIYLGNSYRVDLAGKVWRADHPEGEVPFNDRTIIVQYLCEASGLPPRGTWISFLELPDGAHHYVPLQTDATGPLAEMFGDCPEKFSEAAEKYGGRPIELGDYSYYIPALPKLPLAVVLWEGDDEFKARSSILYDSVSASHLTTAALWVLGVELAKKMIACLDDQKEMAITWLEGVKGN